jgi:hypothetical protein
MRKITVASCAYQHSKDIDPNARVDAKELDALANRCIGRAADALERECPGYTDLHRANLSGIFRSMQSTHKTIRGLLQPGADEPTTVDALSLARLQLEALYAICLMAEDSSNVDCYLRDGWKKSYARFLLQREECKNLARFANYLNNQAPKWLKALQNLFGVSEAQRMTIERDELSIPLPVGVTAQKLEGFPTPGGVVERIKKDPSRKRMLERLYPEYKQLSSFVHNLPEAGLFKAFFDKRFRYRNFFSEGQIKETWQKEIGERAVILSYLSIAQAAAELVPLYPNDVELRAAVTDGWKHLAQGVLLGVAIWEVRTKALLGALS